MVEGRKDVRISDDDFKAVLARQTVRVQDVIASEPVKSPIVSVVGPGVSFAERLRGIGGRLGHLLNRNRTRGN